VSDGGLLIAVAEMALAGSIGTVLNDYDGPLPLHAMLFGEDQGRYIVATANSADIMARAKTAGIPIRVIGETGGDAITIEGEQPVPLQRLRDLHEDWLPHYMSSQ
jgi:phosphoribosylformylglycinamidine synthase